MLIVFYRASSTIYMSLLAILMLLIFIFKTLFFDIISRLFCGRKDEKVPTEILRNVEAEIKSERSLTKSYKLENNPDYFEILAIMNVMDTKQK